MPLKREQLPHAPAVMSASLWNTGPWSVSQITPLLKIAFSKYFVTPPDQNHIRQA